MKALPAHGHKSTALARFGARAKEGIVKRTHEAGAVARRVGGELKSGEGRRRLAGRAARAGVDLGKRGLLEIAKVEALSLGSHAGAAMLDQKVKPVHVPLLSDLVGEVDPSTLAGLGGGLLMVFTRGRYRWAARHAVQGVAHHKLARLLAATGHGDNEQRTQGYEGDGAGGADDPDPKF